MFCNDLTIYTELKNKMSFQYNVGFCISLFQPPDPIRVSLVYNRNKLPIFNQNSNSIFQVGSIITHINSQSVMNCTTADISRFISEPMESLSFVATDTEFF